MLTRTPLDHGVGFRLNRIPSGGAQPMDRCTIQHWIHGTGSGRVREDLAREPAGGENEMGEDGSPPSGGRTEGKDPYVESMVTSAVPPRELLPDTSDRLGRSLHCILRVETSRPRRCGARFRSPRFGLLRQGPRRGRDDARLRRVGLAAWPRCIRPIGGRRRRGGHRRVAGGRDGGSRCRCRSAGYPLRSSIARYGLAVSDSQAWSVVAVERAPHRVGAMKRKPGSVISACVLICSGATVLINVVPLVGR